MSNANHRPSFTLTKLFRKKSEKGSTYFGGRLGGARVALLKSNETADDGGEIWNLVISEAPPKRDNDTAPRKEPEPDRRQSAPAGAADWQRPGGGDSEIPFAPWR